MHNLKIGHFTNLEHGTGVSVFLFEQGASGAYLISGAAPASHELAVLDPEMTVPFLHGLVLAGGSAFGLYAAKGAMRFLVEHGIGFKLPNAIVPIVPAAGIYDLSYKIAKPPTEEDAYQACILAKENNIESGPIGAGTGATVGKFIPNTQAMTSGIGRAEITLSNGVQVIAYAVVNALGDVRDKNNKIIAGAQKSNGEFADCTQFLLAGNSEEMVLEQSNTTLVALFTNAKFSKPELKQIAKMAVAGMARAISPAFTRYDGDMVFAISVGEEMVSTLNIGTMAAEAVRIAICDAVKTSSIIT